MKDPFWRWFAVMTALATVLAALVLALLGHGAVVVYPLQFVMQLVPLLLYLVLPVFLVVAAWRWARAMLQEQRLIRQAVDRIAQAVSEERRL